MQTTHSSLTKEQWLPLKTIFKRTGLSGYQLRKLVEENLLEVRTTYKDGRMKLLNLTAIQVILAKEPAKTLGRPTARK